jgi:trehalose 6-phosphate synthase/phosphatase
MTATLPVVPRRLAGAVVGAPRPMAVAVDLDGTIAPLADHPDLTYLSAGALDVLDRLVRGGRRVAVVSGRSLADLGRFGFPEGVRLVGSHGLEDGVPHALMPEERRTLAVVARLAERAAARAEGLWVEVKPAGVALHRRMAAPSDGVTATAWFAERVGGLDGVWFRPGVDVLEVAVVPTSKLHAVARLRASTPSVLYVGDDITDEDVLGALAPPDIGVKVGRGPTAAAFRVDGPDDVVRLLELVADQPAGHLMPTRYSVA